MPKKPRKAPLNGCWSGTDIEIDEDHSLTRVQVGSDLLLFDSLQDVRDFAQTLLTLTGNEPAYDMRFRCQQHPQCTLEHKHKGDCMVRTDKGIRRYKVFCTFTPSCYLPDGHRGECAIIPLD